MKFLIGQTVYPSRAIAAKNVLSIPGIVKGIGEESLAGLYYVVWENEDPSDWYSANMLLTQPSV